MPYTRNQRELIARNIVSILISRGIFDPHRLFRTVEELWPSHGLHYSDLRRIIHETKTR